MEEWKQVKDYEGLYEVNRLGVIKSVERIVYFIKRGVRSHKKVGERILKTHLTYDGYERVCLHKNGVSKMNFVHKLVLSSFIGTDPLRNCVDHINGIRADNRIENLRWATIRENQLNPITRKRLSAAKKGTNHHFYGKKFTKEHAAKIGQSNKNGKCSVAIIGINKQGFKVEYPSINEANRSLGINRSNIWRSCMSGYKTAGGYKWHYKERYDEERIELLRQIDRHKKYL